MIKRVEIKGNIVTIESDYGIFTKDLGEKIIYIGLSGRRESIGARLNKRNKNGIKRYDINEEGKIFLEWRPEEPDICQSSFSKLTDKSSIIRKIEIQEKALAIELEEGIFTKGFDEEVWQLIIWGTDRIIVQVDTLGKQSKNKNRNIYCLNEKAEILWQIQDPDTYRPGLPQSDSPFTGISISEDGKLKAWNWNSSVFDVDIETGRLLDVEWTK